MCIFQFGRGTYGLSVLSAEVQELGGYDEARKKLVLKKTPSFWCSDKVRAGSFSIGCPIQPGRSGMAYFHCDVETKVREDEGRIC